MIKHLNIDFDGTLAKHKYPDIGDEVPHAFLFCHLFQKAGIKLILYTMRSEAMYINGRLIGDKLTPAIEWCKERGLEFWGVNINPEQKDWTISTKSYASKTIDDNNAGCPLIYPENDRPYVDWLKIGPQILYEVGYYANLD